MEATWQSEDGRARLFLGDCEALLRQIACPACRGQRQESPLGGEHFRCEECGGNSERIDAVVTDPPYGIGIAANPVRQAHEKLEWRRNKATPAKR